MMLRPAAGNVFGVVPNNAARDVSIILMVIHEVPPSRSSCLMLCKVAALKGLLH